MASKFLQDTDSNENKEYSKLCRCEDNEDEKIMKEILGYRYSKIGNRHLGCGGSGYVVKAIDTKVNRPVVIKVLPKSCDRNISIELQIPELVKLKAINQFPVREQMLFGLMNDYVESLNWIGIVFPFYGPSLYNIQHHKGNLPFTWDNVVVIAYQLVQALKFLHKNGIAHLDIKPGNIVSMCGQTREVTVETAFYENNQFYPQEFLELKDPRIRIVDFGSSAFIGQDDRIFDLHSNALPYRAPELILGSTCTPKCDEWSVGCTIMEFYYGFTMFPINNDIDHLVAIQSVIGPLPASMLRQATLVHNTNSLEQTIERRKQYCDKKFKTLKEFIIFGPDETREGRFFRLIHSLLTVNPQERITFEDALKLQIFLEVPDYIKMDIND